MARGSDEAIQLGEAPFNPSDGFRFGISGYHRIFSNSDYQPGFSDYLWYLQRGSATYSLHPIERNAQGAFRLYGVNGLLFLYSNDTSANIEYRDKSWPNEPSGGKDKMLILWDGDSENQKMAELLDQQDKPAMLGKSYHNIVMNQISELGPSVLVTFSYGTNVFANATKINQSVYSINTSIISNQSQERPYEIRVINGFSNSTRFYGILTTDFFGQLPSFVFNDSVDGSIEDIPYIVQINTDAGWNTLTTFHSIQFDGISNRYLGIINEINQNISCNADIVNFSASSISLVKMYSEFNCNINSTNYSYVVYIDSDMNESSGYIFNEIGADFVINYTNNTLKLFEYTSEGWVAKTPLILAGNASAGSLEVVTTWYDVNTTTTLRLISATYDLDGELIDIAPTADGTSGYIEISASRGVELQLDKYNYSQNDTLYLDGFGFKQNQTLELNIFDSNNSLVWSGNVNSDENGSINNSPITFNPANFSGFAVLNWNGLITSNFYVLPTEKIISDPVPLLQISYPQNASIVNYTWISGSANPSASLFFDGVPKSLNEEGVFNETADFMVEGSNEIELLSLSEHGIVNFTYLNVTLDTIRPFVELTTPLDNSTLIGTVGINGSTRDSNLDYSYIAVDTTPLCANCTFFEWNTSQVTNGGHTVELRAYDKAGNANSTSIVIDVDN
jgi:hypothetical protein